MNKRKNYFIDKGFQSRFIVKFCLVAAAAGAMALLGVYALAGRATTVSFVDSRVVVKTAADYLFPLLVQTFLVSTVVVGFATLVTTLFMSHRIAGPAYRFKKVLGSLREGDFSVACKIRSKDSLKDVAAAFEEMITSVRKKLDRIDRDLTELEGKVAAGDLEAIKTTVVELDRSLRNFKF